MARQPALIVHAGAGPIPRSSLSQRRTGCRDAAAAGWIVLKRGGSALDAVQAAVVCMEDNPLFNAGTGAPLNSAGEIELDASIMDGSGLNAGAVAAVKRIRNPIRLARRVMEDERHVLLVSEGAEQFAQIHGFPLCDPAMLRTERQHRRWTQQHGTVGCVALDEQGRLAAATSTGGIFDKLPGRVGDSALIGCGTYANHCAAVSCTGVGEAIIRVVLAKVVVDMLTGGQPPAQTAEQAVQKLAQLTGSQAGLILVNRHGEIGYAHNTSHMPVCWMRSAGEPVTDI